MVSTKRLVTQKPAQRPVRNYEYDKGNTAYDTAGFWNYPGSNERSNKTIQSAKNLAREVYLILYNIPEDTFTRLYEYIINLDNDAASNYDWPGLMGALRFFLVEKV